MKRVSRTMHVVIGLVGVLGLAACGTEMSGSNANPTGTTTANLRTVKGVIANAQTLTINGLRFDTSQATVRIDDEPAHPEDLKPGMIATVRAEVEDHTARALEVEVEHVLSGKVSGRDGNVLLVSGHEVEVEHGTELELGDDRGVDAIADGERVKVSGFGREDGSIHATRIEREPGEDEDFEVKGFVSDLVTGDTVTFTLKITPDATRSFAVTLAPGVVLPAGVQNGSFVEVKSLQAPQDGAFVASEIELEDDELGEENDEVEIEGIVTSGDATSFVIAGQTVKTDASTEFENGTAADIAPGAKLEAEGHLDASGVLLAEKVSFRSLIRLQGMPQNLDAAQRSFTLLGLTVRLSEATEIEEDSGNPVDFMTLGEGPVQVRGMLASNGTDIMALRVRRTGDERLIVQGLVSAKDAQAGTLAILGLTVQATASTEFQGEGESPMTAAAFFDAVIEGSTVVKARGRDASALVGSVLTAEELELESEL